MKFILISGLSGAGKSKAASFLEDMGYYVVDNMPAALIPKFAELCMAGQGQYDRVAVWSRHPGRTDLRRPVFRSDRLHEMGCDYKRSSFVEATLETIVKAVQGRPAGYTPWRKTAAPLAEAVRVEPDGSWSPRVRQPGAEYIADTSAHSPPQNCAWGRCSAFFGRGGRSAGHERVREISLRL
ncbi:MAG: RNase adapter RapZ [Intestinimonas sp.]